MFDHCWRQPGSAIDSYVHSCAEGYLVPSAIILTHTSQFMSLLVVTLFEPSSLRIPSQSGSFWWVDGVSWFLSLRSDIVLNELLAVGLCYSYLLACGSFVTACWNNPDRLPKRLLRAEFDFFKRFSQYFRSKGTSSFQMETKHQRTHCCNKNLIITAYLMINASTVDLMITSNND